MRRQVSSWQERWQIDYHISSVVMQRSLRHRSKRIDAHRRSSPVICSHSRTDFDKKFLSDNKSLFDTAPLLNPFSWLCSGFEACRLNRWEKSTAKEP